MDDNRLCGEPFAVFVAHLSPSLWRAVDRIVSPLFPSLSRLRVVYTTYSPAGCMVYTQLTVRPSSVHLRLASPLWLTRIRRLAVWCTLS